MERNMEITVAKSAGFCFGVQRAVDSVYKELRRIQEKYIPLVQ